MIIFSADPTTYRLNGRLPVDPDTGLSSQNFFLLRHIIYNLAYVCGGEVTNDSTAP